MNILIFLIGYGNTLIRNESNLYQNKGIEKGWTAMRPPLVYGCVKSNFYVQRTIHQYSRVCNWFLRLGIRTLVNYKTEINNTNFK